jgi:FixJ family two-component response regulator
MKSKSKTDASTKNVAPKTELKENEAEIFEALVLGLSVDEVAEFFKVEDRGWLLTIEARAKIQQKMDLLRAQWQGAKSGDAGLLKHLGKQLIGQEDSQNINFNLPEMPMENLTRVQLLDRIKELTYEAPIVVIEAKVTEIKEQDPETEHEQDPEEEDGDE